jgi:hypothetical protein
MQNYSLLTWLLSPIPRLFPALLSLNSPSQNLAPALIMLRVVLGRARPDTEWNGKISGLQFSSAPGVQESTRSRLATSTILTVARSHHGEEANLEANGGGQDRTLGWTGEDGYN